MCDNESILDDSSDLEDSWAGEDVLFDNSPHSSHFYSDSDNDDNNSAVPTSATLTPLSKSPSSLVRGSGSSKKTLISSSSVTRTTNANRPYPIPQGTRNKKLMIPDSVPIISSPLMIAGPDGLPLFRTNQPRKTFTNHRERFRQQNVSGAFSDLRKLLPTHPLDKKLSKSEILKLSIKYIRLLQGVLKWQEENNKKKWQNENTKIF